MKTILVTGSLGFIGFHLVKRLLSSNYNVIGIDNLNNYYDIKHKKLRQKDINNFVKANQYSNRNTFYKLDISNKDK